MTFYVELRDPVSEELLFSGLEFIVDRYSWNVFGGPDVAIIRALGDPSELQRLPEFLRADVRITDETGDLQWWGFLEDIRLSLGDLQVSSGLARMSNRLTASYSLRAGGSSNPASTSATTTVNDARSQDRFGIKEGRVSLNSATTTLAASYAQFVLDRVKRPKVDDIRVRAGSGDMAVLTCRGWWHALTWRFFDLEEAVELQLGNTTDVTTVGSFTPFADAAAQRYISQGFEPGMDGSPKETKDWSLYEVDILLQRVGTASLAGISLILDLYSDDGGGAPNALILSSAGLDIDGTAALNSTTIPAVATFTFANQLVSVGTPYHLVLRRSDAGVNATDYWLLPMDDNYSGGKANSSSDAASWSAVSGTSDIAFIANGVRTTDIQMDDILTQVTANNFPFRGWGIFDTQVFMPPLETGRGINAQVGISRLMECGTSNGRLLKATVNVNRFLAIDEEPGDPGDLSVFEALFPIILGTDGVFRSSTNAPIPKHRLYEVVGEYVVPEVIELFGSPSLFQDVENIFVAEAEYNVAQDSLRIRPREGEDPYRLGLDRVKEL